MEQQSPQAEARKKTLAFLKAVPLIPCLAALGVVYLILTLLIGKTSSEPSPDRRPAPDAALVSGATEAETSLPETEETQTTETPTTEPPVPEAPTTEIPTTEAPTETEAPPAPHREGRTIYLTFDDGPGKNTRKVLEILDRYDVPATFFTVGYFVTVWPETTTEIVSHGNLIACHSYSHEYDQCYASANAFMDELEKWKDAVRAAGAPLPDRICVRFPGGSTTPNAKDVVDDIKYLLQKGGYRWFDWNAGDNDKYPKGNVNNLPDEEYFWKSYQENIGWYANDPNASVVMLLHDSEKGTVAILPRMIEDLKSRGYTFDTLDHHEKWDQ